MTASDDAVVYVSYADSTGRADVSIRALVGANAARLERVRAAYDPDGLFSPLART